MPFSAAKQALFHLRGAEDFGREEVIRCVSSVKLPTEFRIASKAAWAVEDSRCSTPDLSATSASFMSGLGVQ